MVAQKIFTFKEYNDETITYLIGRLITHNYLISE